MYDMATSHRILVQPVEFSSSYTKGNLGNRDAQYDNLNLN